MTKKENLLRTLKREGFEEIPCDMPLTITKKNDMTGIHEDWEDLKKIASIKKEEKK